MEVAQQTPQIDLNGDGINDIPEVPPVTLKITIGADGVLKAVTQSTTVDHPIVATPALVEKAEQLIVSIVPIYDFAFNHFSETLTLFFIG